MFQVFSLQISEIGFWNTNLEILYVGKDLSLIPSKFKIPIGFIFKLQMHVRKLSRKPFILQLSFLFLKLNQALQIVSSELSSLIFFN